MVASWMAETDAAAGGLREPGARLGHKRSPANCGPMTQQGTMGAHGHEMHPQGFLRLIGCHETSRQKDEAAQRLHA